MSNIHKKTIVRSAFNEIGDQKIRAFLVEHLVSIPQCYEILEAMCAGLPVLTIEKAQRYMDSCSNVDSKFVNYKVTEVFYGESPLCTTECVCIKYHAEDNPGWTHTINADIKHFQQ